MRQPTPVDRDVTVLGGTPEGLRAVRELLDLGYAVHWVSRPGDAAQPVPEHPRLTYHPEGALTRVAGHVGRYQVTVGCNGKACSIATSAVVVATGNARRAPSGKSVPSSARVLSLGQLAALLAAPAPPGAERRGATVLIALDLAGATSLEMTAEAYALAGRARRDWCGQVLVFYRDLQVDTPGLEATTRRLRDEGVVFCRYDEASVMADDQGVAVEYVEGRIAGDLLVVPEWIGPREDTAALAALLKISVGADGYFQDVNIHQVRPGLTVRRGVFVAGRCHADLSLADAEADAVQVAASVDALLGAGQLLPEEVVAAVDSTKCIRCLTCVRTCPHAAVEIVTTNDVTSAHITEVACRGCAACVGNCPVQAITLLDQSWPAWMQPLPRATSR